MRLSIINIITFIIIGFSFSNTVMSQDYFELFNTKTNNEILIIHDDIKLSELYQLLIDQCDDWSKSYTGDYILRFNHENNEICFDEGVDIVNIKMHGFLCPDIGKDLLYSELVVDEDHFSKDSLPYMVQNHIEKSLVQFTYPYQINIVAADSVKLKDLSCVLNSVLDGYFQFYKKMMRTRSKKEVMEKFPCRIKITHESYFKQIPPSLPE